MHDPRARFEAHKKHHELTTQRARERSLKGWETRRQHNSHLQNIHYNAQKGEHEWRRPNGELVPLRGFTHDHVELMAVGLSATDRHLKKSQKLNTHIKSRRMNKHMGGYAVGTAAYDPDDIPGAVKHIVKWTMGVDPDDWGKRNSVTMNRRQLNSPNPAFHPTGIMTHEIGHLVGPGKAMNFGNHYPDYKGVGEKGVKEFEKAYQWQAPRTKSGRVDMDKVDTGLGTYWNMKGSHPAARGQVTKGKNKGLANQWHLRRQAQDIHEDFAETYRNLLGVPVNTLEHTIDPKTKQPYKDSAAMHQYFTWEDKNNSRKDYMLKNHLSSTAPHARSMADDLIDVTKKNKRKASAAKSRKKTQRKAKIRKVMKNG